MLRKGIYTWTTLFFFGIHVILHVMLRNLVFTELLYSKGVTYSGITIYPHKVDMGSTCTVGVLPFLKMQCAYTYIRIEQNMLPTPV